MKKYTVSSVILSSVGILIMLFLYYLRFSLEPGLNNTLCGGIVTSCGFFVHSGYNVFSGMFVLFIPLFCYVWILVVSGMLAFSGGSKTAISVLLFAGSSATLAIGIVLGFFIIREGSICPLWK